MEDNDMVCYIVPTIAAIGHYILRRNISSWRENTYQIWLSLLLAGGAIFGIVDHLWNGELLLIGENILSDIMLGISITITIFIIWAVLLYLDKTKMRKISKSVS